MIPPLSSPRFSMSAFRLMRKNQSGESTNALPGDLYRVKELLVKQEAQRTGETEKALRKHMTVLRVDPSSTERDPAHWLIIGKTDNDKAKRANTLRKTREGFQTPASEEEQAIVTNFKAIEQPYVYDPDAT